MKFEWEVLYYKVDDIIETVSTQRAKVIGGWIVKNTWWIREENDLEHESMSQSIVFVSNPEHKWIIDKS